MPVAYWGLFFFLDPIGSARAEEIGQLTFTQLRPLGSGELTTGRVDGVDTIADARFQRPDLDALIDSSDINGGASGALPAAALSVSSVKNTSVSPANRGFFGFDALDHFDQRFAGTGAFVNTQFSLEPPDQGLCVGNGFVLETINTALAVYRTDGTLVAGPTALNQFFGLAPEVIRSTPPVFGDFTSDPRCYFDAQTNRFFVLLLQLDVDPATGNFTGPTHQLLAVSKSGDPTDGFNRFVLDTTADGGQLSVLRRPAPAWRRCQRHLHQRERLLAGRRALQGERRFYGISKVFLAAGRSSHPSFSTSTCPRSSADGGLNRSV